MPKDKASYHNRLSAISPPIVIIVI